ncbi:hypothetical protein J3L12_08565 [Meiothermus sp. CFH 77666]|nr:hypothetical protein [Meiothermus sp. CFH 77666]
MVVSTPHPATAVTARIVLFGKRSTKLAGAVATLSRKGRGKGENDKSLGAQMLTMGKRRYQSGSEFAKLICKTHTIVLFADVAGFQAATVLSRTKLF